MITVVCEHRSYCRKFHVVLLRSSKLWRSNCRWYINFQFTNNSSGYEVEDGYIINGDGSGATEPNPGGAGQKWDVAYYNSSRFGANRGR
ncbi:MAG: hypothetical protein R2766_02605 [Saprospiraceae bacterium]